MAFEVLLTEGAERDLEDIYDYIAEFDCQANAIHVLDRLAVIVDSLSELPQRGSFARELLALGIRDYRQVFFKPYRVIYRVLGERVIVYVVADGRRNMQALLARRLLGA